MRGSCLSDDDLAALLDGSVAAAARAVMDAHLEQCPTCAGALETRAARWSLASLANPVRRPGHDTTGLRERLAARPPEVTLTSLVDGDTPAIPRRPPVIPGIAALEAVGRGGMGVVYRGHDTTLDRVVAVKVLRNWTPLSAEARQRAGREALMLARLDHPHVVRIHAAGESDGTPYLVMEWVEGPTLQQRIEAGPFPQREAMRIARDLARALERVHALGIIHRDIKPDNVLLATTADGTVTAKLADFGLARPEDAGPHLTRADDVLGTPAFMAPEQTGLDPALGGAGPAADIHGLGGVLCAMLTGHAPYEAATPLESMQRSLRGDLAHAATVARLPADLRTIMTKCLEPQAARRYRSAGDLADDLERCLDGRPVLARPISPLERLVKWARRRPVVATTAALSTAFVIASLAGTVYQVIRLERANEQITQSRDRAEQARAVAERSLERLTGAAIQRMVLRGDALDPGDQEFLRQVRDEFREWPLGREPVAGLTFRLHGLRRVAGMFYEVGQYADALACQQGELEVLDELARLLPGSTAVLGDRLNTHYRMRFSLYHMRRPAEAADSARESIALLEAAPPDLPRRDRDLAETRMYLGAFLSEQGQHDEGLALMAAAIEQVAVLRTHLPDDINLAEQEANTLYTAQITALNAGREDEWRRWLDRLVTVAAGAIKSFPAAPETVASRSNLTKILGVGLAQQAQLAAEADRRDDALAIAERRRRVMRDFLDGLDPDVIDAVHDDLIDADLQAVQLLISLDRRQEAAAVTDGAVALAGRLVARRPAVWDHARLLARALLQQADLAAAEDRLAAATAALERTEALLQPWLAHEGRLNQAATLLETARARAAAMRDAAVAVD